MNFENFIYLFQSKPLIRSQDFIKADGKLSLVQINRWVRSGKLIQLKRGAYILAESYRKQELNSFYLANNLVWPSYISLEKALEYWGMIPEAVTVYTSLSSKRPQIYETKIGVFSYKHIKPSLFWGYKSVKIAQNTVLIATPEKALLDLFYFHNEQITLEYLDGLRIQNVEAVNMKNLESFVGKFNKPKISRAYNKLIKYIETYNSEYRPL